MMPYAKIPDRLERASQDFAICLAYDFIPNFPWEEPCTRAPGGNPDV